MFALILKEFAKTFWFLFCCAFGAVLSAVTVFLPLALSIGFARHYPNSWIGPLLVLVSIPWTIFAGVTIHNMWEKIRKEWKNVGG